MLEKRWDDEVLCGRIGIIQGIFCVRENKIKWDGRHHDKNIWDGAGHGTAKVAVGKNY